jgi:hypothetical protein
MRQSRVVVISIFVGGLVTLVSGYLIDSLDSGSCAADEPNCRHTFQNSKIFIQDVGTPLIIAGFAAIAIAAIISILNRLRLSNQSEKMM